MELFLAQVIAFNARRGAARHGRSVFVRVQSMHRINPDDRVARGSVRRTSALGFKNLFQVFQWLQGLLVASINELGDSD